MIYFDHAAGSFPKPPQVIEAVAQAMTRAANSSRGMYSEAFEADAVLYRTREKLAHFFHCSDPARVVFTSNITEALNLVLQGLFNPGDHLITDDSAHNAILRPLHRLCTQGGCTASFVRADRRGVVNPADYEPLMTDRTKALLITHASNLSGNVIALKELTDLAHRHKLLTIVDTAQTAGLLPLDMQELGIDVLCFTGHKGLLGPQGTGGLCLSRPLSIRPLKCGGTGSETFNPNMPEALPEHLEAGTQNIHGIAGLEAALDLLEQKGLPAVYAEESALARSFYEQISVLPGITCYGDFEAALRAPIVSFNLRDIPSWELADYLSNEYGIACRAGAHCAPRLHSAMGTDEQGSVRFSFSFRNTEAEIETAVSALKKLL